jgi:hypothetical protein
MDIHTLACLANICSISSVARTILEDSDMADTELLRLSCELKEAERKLKNLIIQRAKEANYNG